MSTPSVGRIVHYVDHDTGGFQSYVSQCHAAVIIGAHDTETVNLCVFSPPQVSFKVSVPHSESAHSDETWHWPEQVS